MTGQPEPALSSPSGAARAYRLVLDDGPVVEVAGDTARYCVLGRRPDLATVGGALDGVVDAVPVTIDDPSRSLSRTHCALGPFEDVLWVSDLGSANGTVLVYPNGSAHRLEPGVRYEVDPGSRILLGVHGLMVDFDWPEEFPGSV